MLGELLGIEPIEIGLESAQMCKGLPVTLQLGGTARRLRNQSDDCLRIPCFPGVVRAPGQVFLKVLTRLKHRLV